jgi:homoserine dehydrogenase
MNRKSLRIGLFGFGCVGQGLHQVLEKTPGLKAEIVRICVKDKSKARTLPDSYFTFDKDDILNDPTLDVVVELIDDAEAAFSIACEALSKRKAVVSANKKMLATHLTEILALQEKSDLPVLYEAACCASMPIIRNLEEYYDTDLLQSITGIVNGSTNFILTKAARQNLSFARALTQAQAAGYAESDPRLDVEGHDARYKLTLLLLHGFGIVTAPEELLAIGIDRIGELEFQYAREKNCKIKLVAQAVKTGADKVAAWVAPAFIPEDHKLFQVDDVFNGVITKTAFADEQFFVGKGAGSHPTASAVLSDLSALTYHYRYEYKKLHQQKLSLSQNVTVEVFVRYRDGTGIDPRDFSEITQTFRSRGQHYLVGKIHFERLWNAGWLTHPEVSILFNPPSRLRTEPLFEEEEALLEVQR